MLLTLLLVAMVFTATKAHKEAKAYERATATLVNSMTAKKLATSKLKSFAQTLSLGLYKNEQKRALEQLREVQKEHKERSEVYTIYFMLLLLTVLGSYFLVSLRAFTLFGSLAASVTLLFGLITPLLMVTIHKEVEYLGDVVLSFESKGVIGSIFKLFESGDNVVAIVILLFSVLVPMVKILSLLFVSIFMKSKFAHGMVKFFKMIGKWSMVDVFVVATFLVYLTANGGGVSRAEIEVGLYFFLAYVIVSMVVSLSVDRVLQTRYAGGVESF